MLERLSHFVSRFMLTKAFLLGLIFGIGIFSKYIFGDHNLAEELSEFFIFEATGKDVNFSPDTPEEPNESLDAVIRNWRDK